MAEENGWTGKILTGEFMDVLETDQSINSQSSVGITARAKATTVERLLSSPRSSVNL